MSVMQIFFSFLCASTNVGINLKELGETDTKMFQSVFTKYMLHQTFSRHCRRLMTMKSLHTSNSQNMPLKSKMSINENTLWLIVPNKNCR